MPRFQVSDLLYQAIVGIDGQTTVRSPIASAAAQRLLWIKHGARAWTRTALHMLEWQDFEGSLRALLRAQECYKDQGNKRLRRLNLVVQFPRIQAYI